MRKNQEHLPLKTLQNGKVEYTPMYHPSYGTTAGSRDLAFRFGFRNNSVLRCGVITRTINLRQSWRADGLLLHLTSPNQPALQATAEIDLWIIYSNVVVYSY